MEQSITAGSDFDGTAPSGVVVAKSGIEAYPAGTVGGLFNFGLTQPASVRSVELKLGGQSAWTVHKKDLGGRELLVFAGDAEGSFFSTEADSFVMTDGQLIVVRTTGATGALFARVSIQQYR
jgi:hypothetical protein